MQYLPYGFYPPPDGIPESLDCCTPLEYPVETALGSSSFLMEDVRGSDSALQAYYRILNTGFRPGFAAGTDYPCNDLQPYGTLLTYVRIPDGKLTYGKWIEGIAQGHTVVSRHGHNEFHEHVGLGHRARVDALLALDRRQRGNAVAQPRRLFELQRLSRLAHFPGEALPDRAAAPGEEFARLPDQLGIV